MWDISTLFESYVTSAGVARISLATPWKGAIGSKQIPSLRLNTPARGHESQLHAYPHRTVEHEPLPWKRARSAHVTYWVLWHIPNISCIHCVGIFHFPDLFLVFSSFSISYFREELYKLFRWQGATNPLIACPGKQSDWLGSKSLFHRPSSAYSNVSTESLAFYTNEISTANKILIHLSFYQVNVSELCKLKHII